MEATKAFEDPAGLFETHVRADDLDEISPLAQLLDVLGDYPSRQLSPLVRQDFSSARLMLAGGEALRLYHRKTIPIWN